MGSIGLRMADNSPEKAGGCSSFKGGSALEICYILLSIPDTLREGCLVQLKPRRCVGKGTQDVSLRPPLSQGPFFLEESEYYMVTIGMNYRVLEGKEDVFERAFGSVLEVMAGMEGHSDSHLYRDVAEASSYLIVSEWSDEQAFADFIKSDQFAKVFDK